MASFQRSPVCLQPNLHCASAGHAFPNRNAVALSSLRLTCYHYCVLSAAGDWLQGPYVYALYEAYGFSVKDIGRLFIAGGAHIVSKSVGDTVPPQGSPHSDPHVSAAQSSTLGGSGDCATPPPASLPLPNRPDTGFGSSMIFGTIVGSLADRQ